MASMQQMVSILTETDKFSIKRNSDIIFMEKEDKLEFTQAYWETNLNEYTMFSNVLDLFLFGKKSKLLDILHDRGIQAVERYLIFEIQKFILKNYPERIEVVI